MARVILLLFLGMLCSSTALKVQSDQMAAGEQILAEGNKLHAMVDKIFAESEERCLKGDVDGATMNMVKWWNKDLPRMTLDQTTRLLDVCVLHHNGVERNSPMGKWLVGCVDEQKDCTNPPLKESFLQMMESTTKDRSNMQGASKQMSNIELANKQKIKSGLSRLQGPYFRNAGVHLNPEKLDPDPRTAVMHEAPGIWVKGCMFCNIASNIAYACDTEFDRKCLIKDFPVMKTIDDLLWDKVLPKLYEFTAPGPTPIPPPSLTVEPLTEADLTKAEEHHIEDEVDIDEDEREVIKRVAERRKIEGNLDVVR